MDETTRQRLGSIEAQINTLRWRRVRADNAGHIGEYEALEQQIDDLLEEYDALRKPVWNAP